MNMVFGFSLMPFMRYFSKLLGKRKALIMGAVVGFVGALIAPLITVPGHPYLPLIPNIFCTLGALLILKFPMTEATMAEVRKQLDARHAADALAQPTYDATIDQNIEPATLVMR
jgi:Na+/melibiose symporter-like transporter